MVSARRAFTVRVNVVVLMTGPLGLLLVPVTTIEKEPPGVVAVVLRVRISEQLRLSTESAHDDGERLAVAPLGSPDTAEGPNATVPSPLTRVTVTVVVPDAPGATVTPPAFLRVKSNPYP
jgi:hypothetical protein